MPSYSQCIWSTDRLVGRINFFFWKPLNSHQDTKIVKERIFSMKVKLLFLKPNILPNCGDIFYRFLLNLYPLNENSSIIKMMGSKNIKKHHIANFRLTKELLSTSIIGIFPVLFQWLKCFSKILVIKESRWPKSWYPRTPSTLLRTFNCCETNGDTYLQEI